MCCCWEAPRRRGCWPGGSTGTRRSRRSARWRAGPPPRAPPRTGPRGRVRGADGLAAWLRDERVDAVVDATHPFAARMSGNAVRACEAAGVPLLVLRRPGWSPGAGDDWRRVPSLAAAAADLPGERVFLTTGRTGLAAFTGDDRRRFVVRSVDPPGPPMPPRTTIVLARGPFTVADETALMREHRIDVLVTKDSGGAMTAAKLTAARDLGVPVVLVDRPPVPAGVPVAATVEDAAAWLVHAG
ncbi:cobalt-precorrin-6A reductase [Actinomadura sp. CNU-125]|uniref:cobalt-precorrin-6A reductase n=1 Tax=Actinomadura sp. CNU-125 TaxID=1904961 RepID=UPI000A8EF3E7|nr:cobalt-precorrin-6A reductase [Actinomadura sp. CNU-125]